MIRHIGGKPLLAALGLIVATNLVALGGVAWNRGGDPGSELVLTQRELGTPWTGFRNRENSGIGLHIDWRVPERDNDDDQAVERLRYFYMAGYANSPDWLDEAKMLSLGFALPPAVDSEFPRYRASTPARDVFLVLELDGPAYRAAVERAQRLLDKARKAAADNPAKPDLVKQADDVQKNVEWLRGKGTRLFVVDAGLDAAALRTRYADRAHYAIVRGRIAPQPDRRQDGMHLGGYIEGLAVDTIHAPAGWLPSASRTGAGRPGGAPPYQATVAWGRRMEPWIVSARPEPAAPDGVDAAPAGDGDDE